MPARTGPWCGCRGHAKPDPLIQRIQTLKSAKKPAKKIAKKAAKKSPAKKAVKNPAKKPAKKPAQKSFARKPPARKPAPAAAKKTATAAKKIAPPGDLLKRILASLDDDKAEDIVTIDLEGRSALCDAAVIASGRSSRHVGAMADHLARRLKESGYGTRPISGQGQGDWVLLDAGDVIVHLFRPEVRDYYDLEGMWSVGGRK
ncbi:MAG TPA: ribosome silencing factor [Rhizomicrobium sp.]|jgi:ribosome-associated protein|nr:ribosome silencing factor [Rhizomicrobium sp.]